MAVVNTTATAITNADASPRTVNQPWYAKSEVYSSVGTVAIAAADSDGSTYRFARIPSSAKILAISVYNDAITGGTSFTLGTYQTAANGSAAKSAALFATALDLSAAHAALAVAYQNLALTFFEKRLWEMHGDTSDPMVDYDIVLVGTTVGTAAGNVALHITWTL